MDRGEHRKTNSHLSGYTSNWRGPDRGYGWSTPANTNPRFLGPSNRPSTRPGPTQRSGGRRDKGDPSFRDLLPTDFVNAQTGRRSPTAPGRSIQPAKPSAFAAVAGGPAPLESGQPEYDQWWRPGELRGQGGQGSSPESYNIQSWERQVDSWFIEADVDKDGRVAGQEASAFFRRSGLPDESLSQMWQSASAGEYGLNRTRFNNALKLVAALQSGRRLSPDVVAKATAQPYPPKFPQMAPLYSPRGDSEVSTSYSGSSSPQNSPQALRAHSLPTGPAAPTWIVSQIESLGASVRSSDGMDPLGAPHSISLEPLESSELPDNVAQAAFVSDARLVSVELRLPPLNPKESARLQILAAVNGSLLAAPALGGGILQWVNVMHGTDRTAGDGLRPALSEDKDSAACVEVGLEPGSHVTCILAEEEFGYLWAGHDNGTISAFLIEGTPRAMYERVASWKAHKHGGIAAMAVTAWGELWTGSTRGSLRVWGDAIGSRNPCQSRSLKRSNGDKPHGELQDITVSTCGSIVWTAGQTNICLWAAFGGHFLGKIETDKLVDLSDMDDKYSRINTRQGLETSSSGKVRILPPFGDRSYQDPEELDQDGKRFRGAMGHIGRMLGKGVRKAGERVMARSQYQAPPYSAEEIPPSKFGSIKGLASLPDNTIWVAYKNGFLERYTHSGRFTTRLKLDCVLTCATAVGNRLWVGMADGSVVVISHDAKELKKWLAHEEPVCDIVMMGPLTFTLGSDGSIKSWSSKTPDKTDTTAWQDLHDALPKIINDNSISVLCGTWNVNETRPALESLRKWLGGKSKFADIVLVGLQEVEMGTSSVAKSIAIETWSKSAMQEKGNSNAQWWYTELENALNCEDDFSKSKWGKVGMRQMSGILVFAFARQEFMDHIGNMATSSVGTGFRGFGGNKGAVAVAFTLFRRRVVAVCSHFAAHQDGVEKRNNNYASIVRQLTFHKHSGKESPHTPPSSVRPVGAVRPGVSTLNLQRAPTPVMRRSTSDRERDTEGSMELLDVEELSRGLQRAEFLVWVGDFNYRVEMEYHDALQKIEENRLQDLLDVDQCRREMGKNKVFHGLKEGEIKFQPTYKFDKGLESPFAYDSSEKMRVPSWTDRIFYRGSKPFSSTGSPDHMISPLHDLHDSRTLINIDDSINRSSELKSAAAPSREVDEISVECLEYNAVMSVTDSDHKPVWSLMKAAFPAFIQDKRRRTCFDVLKKAVWHERPHVMLQLHTNSEGNTLVFEGDCRKTVQIHNKGVGNALVTTRREGKQHRRMPMWLEVRPRRLLVPPGGKGVVYIQTAQSAMGMSHRPLRLYSKLVVRGESLLEGWENAYEEHELDILLKPT
ncbi:hypothetical protein BSKO_12364 [Bryopsis sp. KO-2023]|nr:hypothetical protein BSKO_12364 [Bryopsis sp. KO-2023]